MKGTRLADVAAGEWRTPIPGSYWREPEPNGEPGWCCATPSDPILSGSLRNHTVVEHDDGTITVEPSILIHRGTGERWHGFLRAGIWERLHDSTVPAAEPDWSVDA